MQLQPSSPSLSPPSLSKPSSHHPFKTTNMNNNGGYETNNIITNMNNNGGYETNINNNGGFETNMSNNGGFETYMNINGGYETNVNNNGGYETNNLINPYFTPEFQYEEFTDNMPCNWYFHNQIAPSPFDTDNTINYDFGSGSSSFGSQTQLGVPSFTPDLQFYTPQFQNESGPSEIPEIGQPNLPPVAVEQPNMVQQTSEGDMENFMMMNVLDDSVINLNSDENKEEPVVQTGDRNDVAGEVGSGSRKRKYKSKNVHAERRRREILNDKLFFLRSRVPTITKMDKATILADAISYVKELNQKVDDLRLEQKSSPPALKLHLSAPTGLDSLTPSTTNASSGNKEVNKEVSQSAIKIEVMEREDGVVNIHMFCDRKATGLLHSITTTMDSLGLEIQQANFSCFNGFALDVFRAEKKSENHVNPEQIKAKLIESTGCKIMG